MNPPWSFVVEAESHGAHYTSEFRFEPEGLCTRLTLVFGARPVTFVAKVFSVVGALMVGTVRKALEQDIEDVKRAAEAETKS